MDKNEHNLQNYIIIINYVSVLTKLIDFIVQKCYYIDNVKSSMKK